MRSTRDTMVANAANTKRNKSTALSTDTRGGVGSTSTGAGCTWPVATGAALPFGNCLVATVTISVEDAPFGSLTVKAKIYVSFSFPAEKEGVAVRLESKSTDAPDSWRHVYTSTSPSRSFEAVPSKMTKADGLTAWSKPASAAGALFSNVVDGGVGLAVGPGVGVAAPGGAGVAVGCVAEPSSGVGVGDGAAPVPSVMPATAPEPAVLPNLSVTN